MSNAQPEESVLEMMRALYCEDAAASQADYSLFPHTIKRLLEDPARGRIILFMEGRLLCGYALLIPYLSNEFGGVLLFVDELFVKPEARNKGIGHRFFEFLEKEKPFDAIAIALEVSPDNARGRKLYESLGFKRRRNSLLTYRLT